MCSAAVTCAYPYSTDAIERGCVEKAPTATGELPDGVREKGRSSTWDQGDTRGAAPGECESTARGLQDERVVGKVTSPARAGDRPGELRRWGSDRTTTLSQTGACEWGTYSSAITRPCRRHEEPDEAQGALRPRCPGFRFGVRRAGLNPSTTSRSGKALFPVGPTVRRAALDPRRSFPGKG